MDNLNNLEDSEVLTENNTNEDLQIEEGINIQPEESNDDADTDLADHVEVDEGDDDGDKSKPDPKSKRDYAFQKLKNQKKSLRDENLSLKQEIAQLRKDSKGDPMAKYNPDKYTPEQWRNLEIKESVKQEMTEQNLKSRQTDLQAREREVYNEEFELNKQEFVKEAPDYDEVMKSAKDLYIPDDAMEFIQESDVAPQLAYYLAKNRDQADALANMSAKKRDRYLIRLEDRLENPVVAKVSKAKSTPTRKGTGGSSQDLSSASGKEYARIRREQLNAKSRGNR
jgi:hypothetical protein